MLVQRVGDKGTTSVLIDTSPDLRAQLLDAGIANLDGVIYTHGHADHVHGIDDLRPIVFARRDRLTVWADGPTQERLYSGFSYVIVQPEGSPYPPILDLKMIHGDVTVEGAGGAITFQPFEVGHGSIDALGFRIGNMAYLPDVAEIYDAAWTALEDLDVWVLDALRRDPHPTHAHLDKSLEWIAKAKPKRAILTNMHTDLDYDTLCDELPDHIRPAYDGLQFRLSD